MMSPLQDTTLRVAILTAVICSIATAIYTLVDVEPAPIMFIVLSFAPLITVILWLQKDARRTGVGAVQDWGMFLWFAWPVVIPWYAFKSRGRGGWRLLLGLILLICSTYVTGYVTGVATSWLLYGVESRL